MDVLPSFYSRLSAWLRNRVLAASLIILCCSAGLRVFLVWRASLVELFNGDAAAYLHLAENLLEYGAFLNADGIPEVARTPGYPAFLAAILFIAGYNLRIATILQAFVLSFSVLIFYWLARRILPPMMAFTGGLLAAFSPWGAVSAGMPLTEGLFLFLLVLILCGIYLVEKGARSPIASVLGGVCVGLLTGAAVLVRPLWPLVPVVAATLFVRSWPRRKGVWLLLLAMLVCAIAPLLLWQSRNWREAGFNGLSDISGKAAWRYLASRVQAQVTGQDRFLLKDVATRDDQRWGLSIQETDKERWRRAIAVFQEHPVRTVYSFVLTVVENVIHPSPDVLLFARLNFSGDFFALALIWGGLLILAYHGWRHPSKSGCGDGEINRSWLLTMLVLALSLTSISGICFGSGSRYRLPLELIVPLLAAVGLVRVVRVTRSPLIDLVSTLIGRLRFRRNSCEQAYEKHRARGVL
jgi:4-amino-4-deoxy-L-arabinose transferase-like glycosyltransferase